MSLALTRTVLAFLAAAFALSCGEPDGPTGDPTIRLLTPEAGTLPKARQTLAISGTTTGFVRRVTIHVDDREPIVAEGRGTWSALLDVSDLEDGSHVVFARATGRGDALAETPTFSFVSLAQAPLDSVFVAGRIREINDEEAIPGAAVSVVGDPSHTTVTDALGQYALTGLAPGVSYEVRAAKAGFHDTISYSFRPDTDVLDFGLPLFTPVEVTFVADQYSLVQSPASGFVVGFLLGLPDALGKRPGFAGATVTLDPASGDGPFYVGPGSSFDPQLTATSANGQFFGFNVAPGPVSFTTATTSSANFLTLDSVVAPASVSLVIGIQIP